GGAVVVGEGTPARCGRTCRLQRGLSVVGAGMPRDTEDLVVGVRLDDVERLAATHPLLAVDRARQIDLLGGQRAQGGLHLRALGRAWCVAEHGFVDRGGDGGDSVEPTGYRCACHKTASFRCAPRSYGDLAEILPTCSRRVTA